MAAIKHLYPAFLSAVLFLQPSCSDRLPSPEQGEDESPRPLYHDAIVLGRQLDDPYALENVRSAYVSLYPTKAREDITPTDYYVRFLPVDDSQLEQLRSMGLQLLDHPVDYEILREGDWYHDPSLDEEQITWQYAVVPRDFEFPQDIAYELLHECYIFDNEKDTRAFADVDWNKVEAESFRITGNSALLSPKTKGGSGSQPSGRITICDEKANGGQRVGLAGVTVSCNLFVKFSSTYTDRDGYYQIPKSFSGNPRYRLVFKNSKGFSIGFNLILFPSSISTLGTNSAEGVNVDVDRNSDRRLFRRCVVNNSAYDFYSRCDVGDLNIKEPPSDLCFWIFDDLDVSSSVMLHHGTVLDKKSSNDIFRIVSWIVCIFGPDITLGTRGCESYDEIYARVVHEMAHACHFRKVGVGYWNEYINYIVRCAVSGQDTYGDGSLEGSGYCEVGEMWGYYMQNKLYKERYGGGNPAFGTSYWFYPQILTSVEDRGVSASGIFSALTADVRSRADLRNRLDELFPSRKTSIDQIFNRYD